MSSTLGEEPPRSPISADVVARVERAERRRGRWVKLVLLLGCLTFGVGLIVSAAAARVGHHPVSNLGLALLLVGLLLVFPTSALVALLIGPTWRQRQEHWRLLHSETRHRENP
jgi:hypothetical protein